MTVVAADALPSPSGPAGALSVVNVALTVVGATAGLLFGYDTGVVSGAMLLIRPAMMLENSWHEFIVSGTVLAAWAFSLVGGWAVDWCGRRRTILVAAAVFAAGSLAMALAPDKELLLAGRVVVGTGVGLASVSTPVYLAETSSPAVRGKVITTFNVGVTFGQLVACIVCGAFADVAAGWRWMLGLAGLPSVGLLGAALLLPESPRWLALQGRLRDAEIVLRRLRSGQDEVAVLRELQDIHDTSLEYAKMPAEGSALLRVLRTPSAFRPLLIACLLTSVQQLAGVNTVMYYSASIIQMAGVADSSMAIWLSVLVAMANFAFAALGIVLIERVGRRPLLLGSLGGVMLSLCLLATGFLIMDLTSPKVTSIRLVGNTSTTLDLCATASHCSHCVSSPLGCGFCYSASDNANSWCHALESGEACEGEGVRGVDRWCPSAYSWVAVSALILYLACFSPGLGPVPWTVNSEIHPQWARGVSGSVATSCHWGFNLLVSLTFLSLVESLTAKGAFLVYAAFAAVGGLLVWAVLPETRGVRLEDMETVFRIRRYSYQMKKMMEWERLMVQATY